MELITYQLTAFKDVSVPGDVQLDKMEPLTSNMAKLCLKGQRLALEQHIITSLDFDHRGQREMTLSFAHTDTFRRVSETPSDVTTVPGKFAKWLREGSGVFWASGKPGSGKSTFMKHISDITGNKHTQAALSHWAGSKQLVVVSYYFWSAGRNLQKPSTAFCALSCMIYLRKYLAQLAMYVCGQRWEGGRSAVSKEWSLSELQDCLQKLSEKNDLQSRFCLFIDGLDEYEGDHHDICQMLLALCKSANFKMCVSSRPWNVFERELGKEVLQKLYIHDPTKDDIRKYVTDRLHSHPN